MIVKSRAIVLHRFPYSDSSWIVKVLTRECGVVSFIVKGGKRKESPFKGAMDPLSLCEVVFNQNPQKAGGGDLQFIKEATLLEWHAALRANLMNQAVAQVMAEIILRYAPQGVPLQDEFELLEKAFADLDCAGSATGTGFAAAADSVAKSVEVCSAGVNCFQDEVFARWLLDICDLWGYHLDLDVCSRCERPLAEPAADFHPETGGLVCKACLGGESPRAKPQTLLGLWKLRGGVPSISTKTAVFAREFVENALLAYLRNHIGFLKEIHSLTYLQEIRKLCSVQST
ncbi:MAG: DNA repair protein RecO [Fibrobacter sp.]|nr:DNA repair protein RecO [Fibrobacter sp.]